VKLSGKILNALKKDRDLTIPELAGIIGVTKGSIEINISKLQAQGLPLRVAQSTVVGMGS
jgi:DeoR/GlpR family transcriptional regulator of sugar metabolism